MKTIIDILKKKERKFKNINENMDKIVIGCQNLIKKETNLIKSELDISNRVKVWNTATDKILKNVDYILDKDTKFRAQSAIIIRGTQLILADENHPISDTDIIDKISLNSTIEVDEKSTDETDSGLLSEIKPPTLKPKGTNPF